MVKDLRKLTQAEEEGTKDLGVKKQKKLKDKLGKLKRISFNLKSEQDVFVHEFIKSDGIKEVMFLIEEC